MVGQPRQNLPTNRLARVFTPVKRGGKYRTIGELSTINLCGESMCVAFVDQNPIGFDVWFEKHATSN